MVTHKFSLRSVILIPLLALLLSACAGQAQSNAVLVIHNGLVFTATGGEPIPNGAVVVENGLISAVGPEAEVEFPAGATLIDAQGGTIMPGLIEGRTSTLINALKVDEGVLDSISMSIFLTRPLHAGITTLRAAGWDFDTHPDLDQLRSALAAHGNQLPTIVFAGGLTHAEGNVFEIYDKDALGVITLDEAQQAAQDLVDSGTDQIIFLQAITPDNRAPETGDLRTGLSPEQQEAIVSIAHQEGLRVLAQTSYPEDTAAAVAAGVDEIAGWPHAYEEPLPEELIQTLVNNDVPMLTGFSVGVIRPYEDDVRRFIDAGGTIIFGTFAPNSGPLNNPLKEMNLMLQIGQMTPMEILMSATANASEALGLGDQIGTLEVGKQADIIILNGNPLQDLQVIKDVHTVINNGELVFPIEPEEE